MPSTRISPTPASLLEQLRQSDGQADPAWQRFAALYTPLLLDRARGLTTSEDEAADLVQDTFVRLLRELPRFQYDPARQFRGWLRTVLISCWHDRCRAAHPPGASPTALDRAAAPDNVAEFADDEYRSWLAARALELMRGEFADADWRACWLTAVEGRPAADVAAELAVTVNRVYLARSRILRRLRGELAGLLE